MSDREQVEVLSLAYRPPYDWNQVHAFFASRAVAGIERVNADAYARTIAANGRHVIVSVRPADGEDALELTVRGAAVDVDEISAAARRAFDLALDPVRIEKAFRRDALLAPLVRRRPGLRIPGVWDPFECAVRAVLGQQVTVAAGRTFVSRLVARFGEPIARGADGLTHLFPPPATLADADFAGLGITTARGRTLRALARAVVDGELDFDAPVTDVTAELAALPGIGAWTAQYVALRALGDADAFPAGDLVLRRMATGGGSVMPMRELETRADAWRPWRAYAALHLWRAAAADIVVKPLPDSRSTRRPAPPRATR